MATADLTNAGTIRAMTSESASRNLASAAVDAPAATGIDKYLDECRTAVLTGLNRYLPRETRHSAGLYQKMIDYPFRPAKALRPALCIGTCLAMGGHLDGVLPSAVAFELFHNAFLVHDDVEDGSVLRRHGPTLHTMYGVPIAVNVGDGMLALALEPLLDNVRTLGLAPALRILKSFARMARESVEGQTIELDWIRQRTWDLADLSYLRMVHKKTGWYSFISPLEVGAIAAGAPADLVQSLMRFAMLLGIAFQIQDDLLSLDLSADKFGKDPYGDLWEGKYTLALLHTLRVLPAREREEALGILALPEKSPQLDPAQDQDAQHRVRLLNRIYGALELSPADQTLLFSTLVGWPEGRKTKDKVMRLHDLVAGRNGASLTHARNIAERHAERARKIFLRDLRRIPDSIHKQFLQSLIDFVIHRAH
jgi:geranylgeranyl diphosphate synthase type II